MPTYVPASFDLGRAGPEAVLRAMCAAELTHEVIIALGYLTLLMAGLCDDVGMGLWLFGGTAFAAGLFDMVFVIIQRYNRPRLRRVMELQAARRTSGRLGALRMSRTAVFDTVAHDVDFCVVGGGLAGPCAAVVAARNQPCR